jgi:hypothetical protein
MGLYARGDFKTTGIDFIGGIKAITAFTLYMTVSFIAFGQLDIGFMKIRI